MQEYANTEADPALVEVGDQKITQTAFQGQLSNEQQRMRQMMGDQVNNDYLTSASFKQSVLQRMINRALVEQVASEQNYRIGNQQLSEAIKASDLFQVEGRFDQSAYERYLQSSQFSKARYENALREDKRLQQVTSGYEESALVLPDEIRALLELQAEQRSFDVVAIKQQDYVKDIQITDADINEYYQQNQPNFMEPEKVSVNYLELSLAKIAEDISVEDDVLLAIYEQNQESYVSQEKT